MRNLINFIFINKNGQVVVVLFAVGSTLLSKKKDPKKTPVIDLEEIENINAEKRAY